MNLRTLGLAAIFATACFDEPAGTEPTTEPPPATEKVAAQPVVDLTPPADVAAAPADAITTETGLSYQVLTAGSGDEPGETDTVEVHYTGWTTDGESFDSSYKRNKPAKFPLNKVIAGWTEGLQTMKIGGKTRFWIPEDLAYKGRPGAPAGMLVFDVELLSVEKAPEPPEVPADVSAPPSDAQTTESGLSYKVLTAGTGTAKPGETATVQVHYSGWTTDGKMFDSSVTRGRPTSFPLNRVIPGWTEGLQLMVVGEKTRFWIPVELAYKNRPGKPAGMLVFDVELLDIK
jgi:peptidylprolyl isomerase